MSETSTSPGLNLVHLADVVNDWRTRPLPRYAGNGTALYQNSSPFSLKQFSRSITLDVIAAFTVFGTA